MSRKNYFKHINFNKEWAEEDWEKFFQLQDEYMTQKLDPTLILRLRNRSAKPALTNLDQMLSELGLQLENPVIERFHKRSTEENKHIADPREDPIHTSKEGASLDDLPIFTEACGFAHGLSSILDRLNSSLRAKLNGGPRTNRRGEHNALKLHACWTALNIALGHKIGYDRDCVRGNIAKCKRALKHADTCLSLMNQFSRFTRSSKLRRDLFSKSVRLRNNIASWIEGLRDKFDTRPYL